MYPQKLFYFIYIIFIFTSTVAGMTHWWRALLDSRGYRFMYRTGHYGRYFRFHESHRIHMKNGVIRAVQECRRLFKYNRWNCTSTNIEKPFGDIVDIGCRETAFVYAITSAGLTYEMIKACTQGKVEGCYKTCSESRTAIYKNLQYYNKTTAVYRQCDDKIRYGIKAWENYVFKGEREVDTRANFNIRNSRLGLQKVLKSSKIVCRCHGVTGSCNLRICAEKIAPYFGEIGIALQKEYEVAKFTPVNQELFENDRKQLLQFHYKHNEKYGSNFNYNTVYKRGNLPQVRRRRGHLKDFFREVKQMEFFDYSPDFCKKSQYAYGTKGRICAPNLTGNEYMKGHRSCNEICCYGRGSRMVWKTFQTNCVFKYCCDVVCEKKRKKIEEYYCL